MVLPEMAGDLGRTARIRQWKELREAAQHAVMVLRASATGDVMSEAADRLERAVNAMPTL
jgi:hypothetical protein